MHSNHLNMSKTIIIMMMMYTETCFMTTMLTTGSLYGIDLTCHGVSEDNTNCTLPTEVFFSILEIQIHSMYKTIL